jgi:enterochelin esterase-like enzyme
MTDAPDAVPRVAFAGSTAVDAGFVVRHPDPDGSAESVRLWCDVDLGGVASTTFSRVQGGWELVVRDPPVDRLEYLVDVDGALVTDVTNPAVVGGAFGDHSWLALPSYAEPAWLDAPRAPGTATEPIRTDTPVGALEARVWRPDDVPDDEPLPLLCCHDGPEMAAYGQVVDWAAAGQRGGWLPPMRVALLVPGARNERYSASSAYAGALTGRLLPALLEAFPSQQRPVLLGQSLGALAALHAAWSTPGFFAGLVLQSGSFFTPELDPQESGFEYFADVTGFVASLLAATRAAPDPPVVAMTCGTAEENHANNRLVRDHLVATGLDVRWGETRQGHTWTCWRDLLDPVVTDLLRTVWP